MPWNGLSARRSESPVTRCVACSATYCKFEKLVIFWIAASPYFGLHIHPLSLAREGCEKGSNIFFIHIAAETLSA